MKPISFYFDPLSDGKSRFFLANLYEKNIINDSNTEMGLDNIFITQQQATECMKGYRKYMDDDLFDRSEKDADWYAEHPWIKQ